MDTLGARLGHVIGLAGLEYEAVDALAGLSDGHTGQIVRGTKRDPRTSTTIALAVALGTTSDYLGAGRGRPPSRRRVREAVLAAGVEHPAKVRRITGACKGQRPRSASRSAGARS